MFFDRAQHERGPMQILDVLKFLAHLLRRVAPPGPLWLASFGHDQTTASVEPRQ